MDPFVLEIPVLQLGDGCFGYAGDNEVSEPLNRPALVVIRRLLGTQLQRLECNVGMAFVARDVMVLRW